MHILSNTVLLFLPGNSERWPHWRWESRQRQVEIWDNSFRKKYEEKQLLVNYAVFSRSKQTLQMNNFVGCSTKYREEYRGGEILFCVSLLARICSLLEQRPAVLYCRLRKGYRSSRSIQDEAQHTLTFLVCDRLISPPVRSSIGIRVIWRSLLDLIKVK